MYVSMKGMLKRANEGNYAVMAINCFNIETARAVINAAQSLRAPIIINIVQEHMVNHCDSNLIAPIVKKLAQRASVEVALNFDHGEEIGLLKKALVDGYSSVMVDASRYNLEGNIRMTREIVEFAKQFDASVEGEIGCMGASEGDNYTDDDMKTNPDEALRFAKETGIDALAISFGSSHGNYPEGYVPEFDFERLKEIKENGVVLERLSDHELVTVDADAVVLSLGFRPDNGLVEELKEKGIPAQAIGNAVKDGTIAPASRSGFEAARALFKTSVRTPSFITAPDDMPNFGKISLMKNQEGVYLAYLTDPAAIARILPPPLKPFSVPVVTVSVCHVKEPTFADDYYEAILGVYCTYGKQLGLYPIGLVLGGTGAEMAVQCGRDNGSIPKKLGSEFVIRRNGEHITAQVCRRGTELVNIDLEVGEYNNAMTGMLYQFPEAGKKTYGGGFYFHLDREPDTEGKSHFQNGALLQNLCEYNYHSWEPGFASVELKSSIDDPWGELPIRTVIGGAYSSNDLMVHKLNLCEEIDADILAPYLLTARYDRTAFMETGRR